MIHCRPNLSTMAHVVKFGRKKTSKCRHAVSVKFVRTWNTLNIWNLPGMKTHYAPYHVPHFTVINQGVVPVGQNHCNDRRRNSRKIALWNLSVPYIVNRGAANIYMHNYTPSAIQKRKMFCCNCKLCQGFRCYNMPTPSSEFWQHSYTYFLHLCVLTSRATTMI